jgi:hypothetical protein
VKLSRIGKLSYRTYQLNPSGVAVWSSQVPIDINGGTLQAGDQHQWSTRFGRTSHPISLFQIWRKWLLR